MSSENHLLKRKTKIPKISKSKPDEEPGSTNLARKDEDDSSIFIDDEHLLNKSDIIKSFVANDESLGRDVSINAATTATAATITTTSSDEKTKKKENEQADSDLDDESVTSFGSSIDDYNYYNSRLFDDDDEDDNDDGDDDVDAGQSSMEEFADELDEATTTVDNSIYKQQK